MSFEKQDHSDKTDTIYNSKKRDREFDKKTKEPKQHKAEKDIKCSEEDEQIKHCKINDYDGHFCYKKPSETSKYCKTHTCAVGLCTKKVVFDFTGYLLYDTCKDWYKSQFCKNHITCYECAGFVSESSDISKIFPKEYYSHTDRKLQPISVINDIETEQEFAITLCKKHLEAKKCIKCNEQFEYFSLIDLIHSGNVDKEKNFYKKIELIFKDPTTRYCDNCFNKEYLYDL